MSQVFRSWPGTNEISYRDIARTVFCTLAHVDDSCIANIRTAMPWSRSLRRFLGVSATLNSCPAVIVALHRVVLPASYSASRVYPASRIHAAQELSPVVRYPRPHKRKQFRVGAQARKSVVGCGLRPRSLFKHPVGTVCTLSGSIYQARPRWPPVSARPEHADRF